MLNNEFEDNESGYYASGPFSINDEETAVFTKKPPVKKLIRGILQCSSCAYKIDMSDYVPLCMHPCPSCGAPNFFPLKIKDLWLYEPLGGGGMGSVYHSFIEYDPVIELAVKILPRNRKNDPLLVESLGREAMVGYSFGEHPHLAKVVDFGYADGEHFMGLEFVQGVRLDRIIDSPVVQPPKQILLWALQILSAEQHIYECGFLFRDLKPQNIIIDNSGNAKLIDYGLAVTIEEAEKNDSDRISGSPYYMPPERILGTPESIYSEIYSLGMVLYHAFARKTFYSDKEIEKLMNRHVNALRVNNVAGKLPPNTDPRIVELLSRMINRHPEDRFQTYEETAAEIYKIYKSCA